MQSFVNNPYDSHFVVYRTHLNSTKEIQTVWKVKSKWLLQINSTPYESQNVSCNVKPMFNFLPNFWRIALSVFLPSDLSSVSLALLISPATDE